MCLESNNRLFQHLCNDRMHVFFIRANTLNTLIKDSNFYFQNRNNSIVLFFFTVIICDVHAFRLTLFASVYYLIDGNALCIIWHAFSSHVTIFCKYIEIHVLVISLFLYRSRRMQHRNKSRFLIIHFWVIPILSSKSIKIYNTF